MQIISIRKHVLAFHANYLQWRIKTICMKCQNLFLGKIRKKYFKMSSAENFTQTAELNGPQNS